jgi:LysM repeat protein
MSRIQRALVAASLSAISLSTLTLPAATSAAPPTTSAPAQYVVKPGDFLAGIAAKVGVALPDLLTINKLTARSLILPGDTLVLPAIATSSSTAAANPPVVKAGSLVYAVKFGDFLLGIATTYKVTLADLLTVNNLTVKSLITPGRQLALPANAVAPPAAPSIAATSPAKTAGSAAGSAAGTTAAPAISRLTYTIKNNDFLAGIATRYKVTLNDLLAVNKLKATSLIVPGSTLALPAAAV